jgi:hypothetical protein
MVWRRAKETVEDPAQGARVRRYLTAWEKIGGREVAEKGLTALWKDPHGGPL